MPDALAAGPIRTPMPGRKPLGQRLQPVANPKLGDGAGDGEAIGRNDRLDDERIGGVEALRRDRAEPVDAGRQGMDGPVESDLGRAVAHHPQRRPGGGRYGKTKGKGRGEAT